MKSNIFVFDISPHSPFTWQECVMMLALPGDGSLLEERAVSPKRSDFQNLTMLPPTG